MTDFVALEQARTHAGTRIVSHSTVPSPWSEAAKNLFHLAELPFVGVRSREDPAGVAAWSGIDNVPAVIHAEEPVRSNWAAIVGLVARLAPGRVVPTDPARRAALMGAVELVAGEGGLGWNLRLTMIHDGLASNGVSGFAPRTAAYLAKRYGYVASDADQLPSLIGTQLSVLERMLDGRDFFGGTAPDALDVYVASFLTMLTPLEEADCPGFAPSMRTTFASASSTLGGLVPQSVREVRARMFARHLPWPIQL
ncbi:MAG: hypothetical protein ABI321_17985 [Polyangia bacterium]